VSVDVTERLARLLPYVVGTVVRQDIWQFVRENICGDLMATLVPVPASEARVREAVQIYPSLTRSLLQLLSKRNDGKSELISQLA